MKIEIKYASGIINLPSCVADIANTASESQLRIILSLFAYTHHFNDFDRFLPEIAEKAELSINEVKEGIAFWAEKGALTVEGLDVAISTAVEAENTVQNKSPAYTGRQILDFVEKNKDFRALCNECQNVMGKSFTAHDYNNVMNLKSYYKFSDEYILLLLEHCVESDKANWAYIRKTASNLYDEGISSYSKLENHFSARHNKRSLEYKVRKLLGIGEREFTKTEKNVIEKWIELKLSFDLINKAYEITITNCQGKLSYAYMAKVLDNWHNAGLKTVEDVETNLENYKSKKQSSMSTFDTDDFFEAALKRSNQKMMERKKK